MTVEQIQSLLQDISTEIDCVDDHKFIIIISYCLQILKLIIIFYVIIIRRIDFLVKHNYNRIEIKTTL